MNEKKILIVDDDPLVLKSLSNLIRSKGYVSTGCNSGIDAIRLFDSGESFDIIISDMRMPGIDGVQTIRRIREAEYHLGLNPVPIILITGYADEEAHDEVMKLGIAAYIEKPFDIKVLMDKITESLKLNSENKVVASPTTRKGTYQYASFFLAELDKLKFAPKRIASQPAPEIIINGKKVISFASNNVLGLGVDPRVLERSIEYLKRYGTTCGGSRLVSGNLTIQEELEQKLAQFLGKEEVQLFMTGYMANEGILLALTQRTSLLESKKLKARVVILSDRENHVSIVNGCWLAKQVNGIDVRFYRHCNIEQLERLLKKYEHYDRKIVITEGVYSMLGDVAPLKEISSLAKKYGAFLIVDDAHAIGVSGENGRGTIEAAGATDDVDLIVGTMSKAFGAVGGFIASSKTIIRFLKVQAQSYVFSSALPPSVIGSVMESLSIIQSEPNLRKQLWENVEYLRNKLINMGFQLLSKNSHIIPIFVGDEARATSLSRKLLQEGIFLPEIRWPAVSKGRSLLRCMVTARHEKKHIDQFLAILHDLYFSTISV